MNNLRKAIAALAQGSLFLPEHERVLFRISGADGMDLLHRMSTNDLVGGPEHRAVITVFCTEKGKIVEATEILIDGESKYLLCSAAGSEGLLRWIEKFTITEDIQLTNVTAEYLVGCCIGPESNSSIDTLDVQGVGIWQSKFGSVPCVRMLIPRNSQNLVYGSLQDRKVLTFDSAEEYEFLRVLHAVPAYGHEISTSFNPYEAGLSDAISYTKGCYIGQEVVARIDTYGKIQRELRLLWSKETAAPVPGTPVVASGDTLGTVTSSAAGLGRGIALAVLSRKGLHQHQMFAVSGYAYTVCDSLPPLYSLIFPATAE